MFNRRTLFVMAAGAVCEATTVAPAEAQSAQGGMIIARKVMRGPANRSLMALESSWVTSRFYLEAMMEEGRVPRQLWEKAKLNAIHGNFDIRDPANGDLLQKVEKGVRVPPSP